MDNPRKVSSASAFTSEQIKNILSMKSDTIGDIQDKAFMCVTIFGGLRTQSVHNI